MDHVCYCAAYRFPHRMGGGKCEAYRDAILCTCCGHPAVPIRVDYGIGSYEYWGMRGVHRDIQTVSECCEASLVENTSRARKEIEAFQSELGKAA